MTRLCRALTVAALLVLSGCRGTPPVTSGERPFHPVVVRADPEPLVASTGEPVTVAPARLLPARPLAATYDVPGGLRRPPRVAGKLDVPLQRQWKYILIHHSGTREGSEAAFDRYHREHNGWRGVGYDFVIGNGHGSPDGLVEVTFRWEKQLIGAHAGIDHYNQHAIGICVVGDLERDELTPRQLQALVGLINYLQQRCRIPTANILGHRHVRPGGTDCPGKNFPWYELLARLAH